MPTVADLQGGISNNNNNTSTTSQAPTSIQNHPPAYPPQYPPQSPYPDPHHDPLRVPRPERPFGIGGGDVYPGSGGGFGYIPGIDPFGGGGSLVGPHHPGFGIPDPFLPNPHHFPRGGRLPPRGARFDPFGPPGVRPNPDHDHFRPPGNFDDDLYM